MYKKACFLFATLFGVGYLPKAPGTWGSLATLPLVWLAWQWQGIIGIMSLAITAYILGVLATREVLKHSAHDPSFVVIDEVVGQTLAFALVTPYMQQWWVFGIGFVLFRFFDVCKFGPVKWADSKLENANGVMLDDVFAGIFAAIDLWIVVKVVEYFSA